MNDRPYAGDDEEDPPSAHSGTTVGHRSAARDPGGRCRPIQGLPSCAPSFRKTERCASSTPAGAIARRPRPQGHRPGSNASRKLTNTASPTPGLHHDMFLTRVHNRLIRSREARLVDPSHHLRHHYEQQPAHTTPRWTNSSNSPAWSHELDPFKTTSSFKTIRGIDPQWVRNPEPLPRRRREGPSLIPTLDTSRW